jgi:hypothetical protein
MNKKNESGQVIIILVFGVIGLLGFTALAIDGGMIYSDRRHAQSASDASSLAGGGNIAMYMDNRNIVYDDFRCNLPDVVDAINYGVFKASERALGNDYNDTEFSITTDCYQGIGVKNEEKYIDISTDINRESQTALIHFVNQNRAINEVASTVRVRPTNNIAFGNAIVGLSDLPCDGNNQGVIMGGSSGTYIEGGGIWSNGCFRCTGLGSASEDEPAVQVIPPIPGEISYVGIIQNCNPGELVPFPMNQPDPLPEGSWDIDPPDCNGPRAVTIPQITGGMILTPNTLYCLTNPNNAMKMTNQDLEGIGVTIYSVNAGDIEISGGHINLSAPEPPGPLDPPTAAIPGLLFYVNPNVPVDPLDRPVVKLVGNACTNYNGLIYAPTALVDMAGTIDVGCEVESLFTVFHTQVVGWTVQITGNSILDIKYDKDNMIKKPAYLDLTR